MWLWQADMWRQEIQKHDVLVLTYQILLNTLSAGFMQARPKLQAATAATCHHAHAQAGSHARRNTPKRGLQAPAGQQPGACACRWAS